MISIYIHKYLAITLEKGHWHAACLIISASLFCFTLHISSIHNCSEAFSFFKIVQSLNGGSSCLYMAHLQTPSYPVSLSRSQSLVELIAIPPQVHQFYQNKVRALGRQLIIKALGVQASSAWGLDPQYPHWGKKVGRCGGCL